jgi:polyadenylate-binding protein
MKPQHVPQVQAPAPENPLPNLPVKLTPQILATFPAEEQKSVLGERIYPLILKSQPALAGKITGMILDSLNPEEILNLIENADALNDKVGEALKVLQEHEGN